MRNSGLGRVRMSPHVRYSMSVTAVWWCGLYARFARVLPTVPEAAPVSALFVACRSTLRCVWGADQAAATLGDAPIASVARRTNFQDDIFDPNGPIPLYSEPEAI